MEVLPSFAKMSGFVLLLCLVVFANAEDQKYTTKYDDLDVDEVIKSDRLVSNYVGCLLETNPCTPDATELKKNLPDALATDCSSCSEAQKIGADKFCQFLIDNRKEDWEKLEEKFDPTGAYRTNYMAKKEKEKAEQN